MDTLRALLLSVFGLGYMRPASGTWGSMPPAGMVWLMLLLGVGQITVTIALLTVLAIACVICVVFGDFAEKRFGKKDASEVVIDEVAGQCLPLLFWPASWFAHEGDLTTDRFVRVTIATGCAFLLFRIFDIIKPPPARGFERLPKGWGVLIDDLFAGLYAAIFMQAILRFAM